MKIPQIVLDTNVLISAQRSQRGASSRLLSLLGLGYFEIHLSVPLVLEYEDVLMRHYVSFGLTQDDITDLIDAICALSKLHKIYYLWRPYLRDLGDEFILDLAVTAKCDYIVTFNQRDFIGVEKFGIGVVSPNELLKLIGEKL